MTAAVFAVSLVCLLNRIYVVYQYLFLIPIIAACFWYKKKGVAYSAAVSAGCIYLYAVFTRQDFLDEIVKLAVFVGISMFVEFLVERMERKNADIFRLNRQLRNRLEMMKKSEELSGMGSWRMELKTNRMVWSDELYRIFGIGQDRAEPSLESWLMITHPEDREMVDAAIRDSLINGQNTRIESRIIRPDGGLRWIVSISYTEYDETGKPETYIGSFLDITERKKYEQELYKERERFKITLSSIGDGVISTDMGGNVTLLNKQAEKLTGWEHLHALGRPFDEIFNIVNEKTRVKNESPIRRVIQSGITLGLANHTVLISRYGTEYSIADSAAPIKDGRGKILGVVIVFRDVTEEKKRQDQIRYISYHDALTGLYNRRYCEEQLAAVDIMENLPISVVMGDLNGLKMTNDAFGHTQGDRLLQKAAEAIGAACGANGIAARWGGDEFVVLLPGTNREAAEKIVEKIEKIESGMKVGPIGVSVSFGCGTKEKDTEEIRTALKNAEDRMYENKVVESESTRGQLIETMIATLCDNNPFEIKHYKRVGELAQKIGEAMHLPKDDIARLKKIGRLHDIGKIAVDSAILSKKGTLTQKEMDEIRRHPDIGYKILKSSKDTAAIAEYVLYHHERYDGQGFPAGLKGEKIPLLSRIVMVADAFDAMTHDRSYRKAMTVREAVGELESNKGTQFDPAVVNAALQAVGCT
jgi:diguanylate cyclase (GGDEF)-like protein/PAS domain S-box-containing protein